MSTEINEPVRVIGEGCISRLCVVPELLVAAVPEFLGGLAVVLITALVAWTLRLLRARRVVSAPAEEETG